MAWEYSDNEYIKLYRKLINWEWYSEPNTKVVFLHCLLKANWKPTSWHGIDMDQGEFIQSNANMAKELGLSFKQIRTALGHLEGTNSVTFRKAGKYRVINVSKYIGYQSKGTERAQTTAPKGHQKGTKRAQDIRSKEHIRSKENNIESSTLVSEDDEDDKGMTLDEIKAEFEKERRGTSENQYL